ncbi:MAG TPA: TolC family protein [Caldimonas sp.]|jgi:outer membrane protein TolC|nr:TolC family protein [Caldimonas sp.]HEX2539649.1 TolC family protein [Caldimonas sp.]
MSSTALRLHIRRRLRSPLSAAAALLLAGCGSTAVEESFDSARQMSRERLGAELQWLRTDAARREAQVQVDAFLAKPLGADDAVRIALAHSPALQAMLFESAADSAAAAQTARLPNPVFDFERMVRREAGARELEITRALSFSLLDLLLLPARLRTAAYQQEAHRLTLASNVVQAASEARRAWVSAVAAQQSVRYAQQVKASADASAELARRMQEVGNFSRLQRAREQAFAADAVAQLARATQSARASREALVRTLGLDAERAARLTLPDRLPDLPGAPRDEGTVAQAALDQRLDVRMARANVEFAAGERGLNRVTALVDDLEVGVIRQRETHEGRRRGVELSVPLPLFDAGDLGRTRAEATALAAVHRAAQVSVEASSQVREGYAAYRTAYDVARHYRDEIVPLRRAIADENVLRYNAMLIGVFELLADSREQIASVVQAIEAQRDFWLADAALQATLIGQPIPIATSERRAAPSSGAAARH